MASPSPRASDAWRAEPGGPYARYVLGVLLVVYVLNFIDRQILSVLAESIKQDLALSDADLGFLFGAAFAVFYAVMGLPLAKLADGWSRKRLIAAGLTVWSLMTAASGFARGFVPLAICRFGVGAGEASASPAAYSMLYDYFPKRWRTTVLAIYSGGAFIGQSLGIFLGGYVLTSWAAWYPDPATAPLGLVGWQAAFLCVGLPGVLLAAWVLTLREPVRGALDGIVTVPPPHPFRDAGRLFAALVPPTSFIAAARGGARRLRMNLIAAVVIAAATFQLVRMTGDVQQWVALGVGLYAVVSWAQALAGDDPACAASIFENRSLLLAIFGTAAANFMITGFQYWSIPYYQRHFAMEAREVGNLIGLATLTMGVAGVALGGTIADRLRVRRPDGKLLVLLGTTAGCMVGGALMLAASTVPMAFVGSLLLVLCSSAGLGPAVSTMNDLVLPRMRATASAFGFMVTYLLAGALGPYAIGKLSDVLGAASGSAATGLRGALAASLLVPCLAIVLVFLAMRTVANDESMLLARARASGETA